MTTWAGITVKAAKKARKFEQRRGMGLARLLENLESRLLLDGNPFYHAGDLDTTYAPGHTTPLPGTVDYSGWYTTPLLDATGNPLVDPLTGIPSTTVVNNLYGNVIPAGTPVLDSNGDPVLDTDGNPVVTAEAAAAGDSQFYYAAGFWGYANYIKTALVPAANGQPAKIVIADCLTGHLRVGRYLFDGPIDTTTGLPSSTGQVFDSTFNGGQPLIIDLGAYAAAPNPLRQETLGNVAVDAAGNIYVAGSTRQVTFTLGMTSSTRYDVNAVLAKITPAGVLDTTFDIEGKVDARAHDGVVIYDFANGQEEINALVLMPNGKVVIGGSTTLDPGINFGLQMLLEFNTDGSVNNSFGTDGRAVFQGNISGGYSGSIIYATGAHYSPTEYGGWANRQYEDRIAAMTLTPSGQILVAGSMSLGGTDTQIFLERYNPNGTLDTTFNPAGVNNPNASSGRAGVVTFNPQVSNDKGCGEDGVNQVVYQPDGKILLVGYTTPASSPVNGQIWARRAENKALVARFTSEGLLDTTFADRNNSASTPTVGYIETGMVATNTDAYLNAVIVQSDGKIIVGGYSSSSKGYSFALERFQANGAVDNQFGTNGVVITRLDTVTTGSGFLSGNYSVAETDGGYPQVGYQDLMVAQDMVIGMYLNPTNGSIQTVGYSMTTAPYQGISIPGINGMTVPDIGDGVIPDQYPSITTPTAVPAFTAFGQLEFVRYKNDSANTHSDTNKPLAVLIAPALDDTLTQYQFQVAYTDESAIRLASLGSGNIVVTGPNGYSAVATVVAISSSSSSVIPIVTDQSPVYVTYRVTSPTPDGLTPGWIDGDYAIALNPLSVSDTFGNFAIGGNLGTVTVDGATDYDTPVATLGLTPNITTLGGLFYDFTVTYTDNFGINVASITSTNIRITSTTKSFNQLATLINVDQPVNGTTRIATYRIVAPTGGWSATDAGTYQIIMQNNQVGDTAYPLNDPQEANDTITPPGGSPTTISHFVTGGSLGSFQLVVPDTAKPTATLAVTDVTTSGGTSYSFSVTFSDNVSVNIGSLLTGNITVTGPNGFSQVATFESVSNQTNGTPRAATYSFTPPGGAWAPTNFGVYTITMNANQVYDTSSNSVDAGALGTFRAYLASDVTRPTAVVLSAPDIVGLGGTSYTFTVRFTDDTALMVSTIGTGNLVIAGPNYNQTATLVSVDSSVNGTPRVATFRINAPTGGWVAGNVGAYSIVMAANQVTDTSGNYVLASQIGSFNIRLQDTQPPTALLAASAITLGTTNYSFQVSYADNTGVDTTTLGHGEIVVTGPNGYSQVATFQGSSSPVAGTVVATYGITSPGAVWGNADVGSYAINLLGGKVADLSGNVIAAQALGTTNVPDTMGPTMTLNAPNVAGLGATSYQFTVTYTDPSGIDLTSFMDGNVKVTGPNSYTQSALLQSIVTNTNGSRTVTYRVTPPGGVWSTGSGGAYTVTVQNPLVRDTLGNAVAAGVLGTFQVTQAIAAGGTLTANPTTGVNNQPVVLTATVTGNAGTPTGTVTFADGATTLGTVTLTNGTATWAVASLTLGTHNLTATYNGSLSYSSKVLTLSYLVGTVNQRTVNQIYLDILGRNADSSGLNYFVTYLNQGHSRGEVANILLTSQEYRMKTVQSLYQTYLGRNADTGGMNNFLGLLQSGGTMDNVRTTILGSAEYYSRAGSTYEGYISRLYQQVLGRAADQAGLTSWTNTLASGVSRTQVASIFLSVREYRTNLVNSLYTTLLLRNSDAAGLNSWVGRMFTGTTNNSIAIQFINSAEYASVHQLV